MAAVSRHAASLSRIVGVRAARLLNDGLVRLRQERGAGSIILPANVCPIVPLTCWRAGFTTEFVDIDLETQCITADAVAARLEDPVLPPPSGVIFVHPYGRVSDDVLADVSDALGSVAEESFLIDDRCSLAPEVDRPEGDTPAEMVLFSTGYAKRVDIGYGGIAWVPEGTEQGVSLEDSSEVAFERAREFFRRPVPREWALSGVPHEWLASGAVEEREYLDRVRGSSDRMLQHEQELRHLYASAIPERFHLGTEFEWRFNLQVSDPHAVLGEIFDAGLFASSHYASVARPIAGVRAPNAERSAARMVNLFLDERFTVEMAERCAAIVTSVAERVER